MTCKPVHHEPAVASACSADFCRIHRVPCEYFVCKVHQILKVDRAVFAPDIRKGIPAPIRADDIRKEHDVSMRCPYLHFMEEAFSIGTSGTSVYIQYARISFRRIIALWQKHPSMEFFTA